MLLNRTLRCGDSRDEWEYYDRAGRAKVDDIHCSNRDLEPTFKTKCRVCIVPKFIPSPRDLTVFNNNQVWPLAVHLDIRSDITAIRSLRVRPHKILDLRPLRSRRLLLAGEADRGQKGYKKTGYS